MRMLACLASVALLSCRVIFAQVDTAGSTAGPTDNHRYSACIDVNEDVTLDDDFLKSCNEADDVVTITSAQLKYDASCSPALPPGESVPVSHTADDFVTGCHGNTLAVCKEAWKDMLQSEFPQSFPRLNMMSITYGCLRVSEMLDMCNTNVQTIMSRKYISSPDYPDHMIRNTRTFCQCDFSATEQDTGSQSVEFVLTPVVQPIDGDCLVVTDLELPRSFCRTTPMQLTVMPTSDQTKPLVSVVYMYGGNNVVDDPSVMTRGRSLIQVEVTSSIDIQCKRIGNLVATFVNADTNVTTTTTDDTSDTEQQEEGNSEEDSEEEEEEEEEEEDTTTKPAYSTDTDRPSNDPIETSMTIPTSTIFDNSTVASTTNTPTATTIDKPESKSSKDQLETGQLVGIILAGLVLVIIIIAIAVYMKRRSKTPRSANLSPDAADKKSKPVTLSSIRQSKSGLTNGQDTYVELRIPPSGPYEDIKDYHIAEHPTGIPNSGDSMKPEYLELRDSTYVKIDDTKQVERIPEAPSNSYTYIDPRHFSGPASLNNKQPSAKQQLTSSPEDATVDDSENDTILVDNDLYHQPTDVTDSTNSQNGNIRSQDGAAGEDADDDTILVENDAYHNSHANTDVDGVGDTQLPPEGANSVDQADDDDGDDTIIIDNVVYNQR